jgi:hypothetical protein
MSFLTTTRLCAGSIVLFCLALICMASHGQMSRPEQSNEMRSVGSVEASGIMREIDDPSSGDRWLLVQNAAHPGGPGHLLLINRHGSSESPATLDHYPSARALVPVIRAGDALVVEEHTKVVDAGFEAIALGPARTGEAFRARVKLGGAVVRAVAAGPGHAILDSDSVVRP